MTIGNRHQCGLSDETTAITQARNAGLTNIMVRPLVDFLPDNSVSDPHQALGNPNDVTTGGFTYGVDEFRRLLQSGRRQQGRGPNR